MTVSIPQTRRSLLLSLLLVVLSSGAGATGIVLFEGPAPGAPPLGATLRDLGEATLWIFDDEGAAAEVAQRIANARLLPVHGAVALQRLHGGPAHRLAPGVEEVWSGHRFRILAHPATPFWALTEDGCVEALEWVPRSAVLRTAPLILGSASADDSTLVASVDEARFAELVADLSGHQEFQLDGAAQRIRTRWALDPDSADGISLARDYVQDRFEAAGYTVELQDFDFVDINGPVTATNVIAVRQGTTRPDEILVVGAHYDARAEQNGLDAPGAEDNATGTAGVLHLAELIAQWETRRTIHFIAFSAEETGLRGSSFYAQDAVDRGLNIVGALTMDMISAWVDEFGLLIEGTPEFEELMFAVRDNVTEWTSLEFELGYVSSGSDHVPFQLRGIPATLSIDLDWDEYEDYHKSTDTFDNVDPRLGATILRAMAGAVADIAGIGLDFPAPDRLALLQNRPNPFNPRTSFAFALPSDGLTRLELFDARGRRVRTVLEAELLAGEYTRDWDGTDDSGRAVASGVYFSRLTHPSGTQSSKLTLIR